MSFESLQDVFEDHLKDLLSARKQILQMLPKIARTVWSDPLRETLQEHLNTTEGQVTRLGKVFSLIDLVPKSKKCEGMAELLKERDAVLEETKENAPSAMEAAIIAACQKINQLSEIAKKMKAIAANDADESEEVDEYGEADRNEPILLRG